MWIITKDGFVSLVQHNDNTDLLRARARRCEHLIDALGATKDEIIDLGPDAPDYRWHVDISRADVKEALTDAVDEIDYTSHVKEEVAGEDDDFYAAMMRCWSALLTLQTGRTPEADWWARYNDDLAAGDEPGA